MDDAGDGAEAPRCVFHNPANLVKIADIGRRRQDLRARLFQRQHRADTARNRILRSVAGEVGGPALAVGEVMAGNKDQVRTRLREFAGKRQADPAGDQVGAAGKDRHLRRGQAHGTHHAFEAPLAQGGDAVRRLGHQLLQNLQAQRVIGADVDLCGSTKFPEPELHSAPAGRCRASRRSLPAVPAE